MQLNLKLPEEDLLFLRDLVAAAIAHWDDDLKGSIINSRVTRLGIAEARRRAHGVLGALQSIVGDD